jgi:hypothetical protein
MEQCKATPGPLCAVAMIFLLLPVQKPPQHCQILILELSQRLIASLAGNYQAV